MVWFSRRTTQNDLLVQKAARHDGRRVFAEIFTHVGQWGTHVDPPAHFHKGLRTVDQIELKEMILPLVCIDVHEECAKNPDYTLTLERVKKWETEHGKIPTGSFVAMRTDWSRRWPGAEKMANKDGQGVAHYPGWSLPVLKYLYEESKITASGHETTELPKTQRWLRFPRSRLRDPALTRSLASLRFVNWKKLIWDGSCRPLPGELTVALRDRNPAFTT